MNRLSPTALVTATALLLAGCSTGEAPQPRPPRGTVSQSAPLDHQRLGHAPREWLIDYASEDALGKPITVSGTVSVPNTPPPRGGWPVISWAHGTTGTADMCAPSADRPGGPVHDYVGLTDRTLDRWLAAGYAVAQTDYEGLGTPGEHPYLNGRSAANAVTDIVRAARELDPGIGTQWFAVGHSQGGHAALFTAAADQRGTGLDLRGAISLAPGGFRTGDTAAYFQQLTGEDRVRAILPFLPTMLIGSAAADPGIVPAELLDPQARPVLDAARQTCHGGIKDAVASVRADRIFREGADLDRLTEYLRSQEPEDVTLRVPTLVLQGSEDALVAKPGTDQMIQMLCSRFPHVGYEVFQGADHREVLDAAQPSAQRFAGSLLAGGEAPTSCSGR